MGQNAPLQIELVITNFIQFIGFGGIFVRILTLIISESAQNLLLE